MRPHLIERSSSPVRYNLRRPKHKKKTLYNLHDTKDAMRCGEGAGFLKVCGRNMTMLSLAGRSCHPVTSPTAGPARLLAGGPLLL